MRRTTVKIPDQLDDRLRAEAQRRNMTVSALVREALEAHLGGGRAAFVSIGAGHSSGGGDGGDLDVALAAILADRHAAEGKAFEEDRTRAAGS